MNNDNTYIINLGGSIIVPDDIDVEFLTKFRDLIIEHIAKGQRFLLITGGGKTCRKYQNAAGKIDPTLSDEDKDWLGIHTTRLNGHLIRTIFKKYAYPRINTNPNDLEDFYQCKEPIMIAAGWRPGFSTDYDTVLLAKYLGIKKIVNLSNIDYIYDKDPKKSPDAERVEEVSWKAFREMIGDKWEPGMNAPFDPVASKLADHENLEVVTMGGSDLENLNKYLSDEKFEGSVIRND